ncbi:hypothetical protein HMJ29_10445 [Hymenobacter taeanensis]|uniref:DUF6311 domain-containing protein n=1 Tax=Hymenobacter taeanensis TaxID=2735321 RepID=A0A6M6BHR5_9BACT|nr:MULTISPECIES: hypothetical protein [Hymenobacter]QJX47334.1 hypothetical protein HMJ29_10445 [Hymenobacter taeanensis]UOQ79328.1 hypothetical protein MUN83_10680 [Hymenobacter sp. 5414T-23]
MSLWLPKVTSFLRRKLPEIVLVVVALFLLKAAFKDVFLHPGSYLFSSGGDGLKNNYTYLYHVLWGQGTHFKGMMYPYGDHVVYSDGQPLLSMLLAGWRQLGLPLPDSGLGFMNGLMLWAIPISGLLLYRILRANLVPAWPAVIGALLISFMSPQLERILGHFGLSYGFLIPLYWYILINAFDSTKARSGWLLALYVAAGFLGGLLHPYWVTMAALLALAYGLVALLQHNKASSYSKGLAVRVMVAGLLSVGVFQLFMLLTDNIPDRPASPWGFLFYRASFASIFYPVLEPLRGFWKTALKAEPSEIWEGWAYVGLIGLVALLLTVVRVVQYLIRRRPGLILKPVLPLPLRIGLFAGILCALFGSGVPFIWGLADLLEYMKPLKQFRSIGRFAWVFYYTYTVYVVFYFNLLFRYLRNRRAGRFALSLAVLLIVIWGWEGRNATAQFAKRVSGLEITQDFMHPQDSYMTHLGWDHPITNYQAIVPMPFYLIGSEVQQMGGGSSEYESMRSSIETGLPLVAASMSRASRSRSGAVLQLFSHDVIPKEVLHDFPNQKPLLLLVTPHPLSKPEQNLVSKAQLIYSDKRASLYELPLAALNAEPARIAALSAMTSYVPRLDVVRVQSWAHPTGRSPLGNPSQAGSGNLVLWNGPVPQAQDTTTYEASVWMRSVGMESLPVLHLREWDGQTGQEVRNQEILVARATDVYHGWLRIALSTRLQKPTNRLEVYIDGETFEAADVLIRPLYADVYETLASGRPTKNNLPLQD